MYDPTLMRQVGAAIAEDRVHARQRSRTAHLYASNNLFRRTQRLYRHLVSGQASSSRELFQD